MIRRIISVVYPGFEWIGVAGPISVFSTANTLLERPAYELIVASATGGMVPCRAGLAVSSARFDELILGPRDTVLVTGGHTEELRSAMADHDVKAFMRTASTSVDRYGSVCTGTFVLAAAGLLNTKRCATHWEAVSQLEKFVPGALVDPEAIYVQDGNLWTSAGAMSGVDMALSMLELDYGSHHMGRVAKRLVLYSRRPGHQSQFSALLHAQSVRDGAFAPLLDWLGTRLDQTTKVRDMAARLAMSERTFYRRFTKSVGISPSKFLEMLRLDRAKDLLESGQSVKEVAPAVGFRSQAAFRAGFKSRFGTTPSHHAKMFRAEPRAAGSRR